MPSPKSGKAASPVNPVDPTKALEADVANPGEVEKLKADQREVGQGKYGAARTSPYKPTVDAAEDETEQTWIEIELVDKAGRPVVGEPYRVTLANGQITTGTLDEKGFARLEPVEPGLCKITFPQLEEQAWKPM